MPTPAEAREFLDTCECIWYQRFRLADDVYTPGERDVEELLRLADFPTDLSGRSVLDIGTANGGFAFEAERRGAERVVAVDLYPSEHFAIQRVRDLLDSRIEPLQANVYSLPHVLAGERFDLILFLGVLYHLRHPLLGLDAVRALARGTVLIETAVADHELGQDASSLSLARFYRRDELSADASNWFSPTLLALTDWCTSSGLSPTRIQPMPESLPSRCLMWAEAAEREFAAISYERPLVDYQSSSPNVS